VYPLLDQIEVRMVLLPLILGRDEILSQVEERSRNVGIGAGESLTGARGQVCHILRQKKQRVRYGKGVIP